MHKLISYIAPSAPATRRPATGNEPLVRPEIGFTPRWYRQNLNIDFGERWHTDVEYRHQSILAMRDELQRRFPGTTIGGIDCADGTPLDLLTGVFGAATVAAIFGLPIVYSAENWPNVLHNYLSREEMAALECPNLDTNPFFQGLMHQLDQIATMEGKIEGFINWQGIINNALRLRGQELFIDMFEAKAACHHLFETVCTTMLDAIQRLQMRQRKSGVDYHFATVSNCSVNMVSPNQYRDFLLPYDRRIAAAFDCFGIHNCAWNADPYINAYVSIPNVVYIDMGLNSDLQRASRTFPHARRAIMYTPMDLVDKNESQIRADFERIADDYAPCDIVIADIEAETADSRVWFAIDLCQELSNK